MKKLIPYLILITLSTQSFILFPVKSEILKKENYNSLKKYIERKKIPIDLEKSLFLKKKSAFNELAFFKTANANKKNINNFSIPDTYLFNKNSILIDENSLGGCIIDRPTFEKSDFYTEILKENKIILSSKDSSIFNLEMLKNNICDYQGNSIYPFEKDKACLIFLWAKNKTSPNGLNYYIEYTIESLKKSTAEIDIYFLNADEYSFL